MEIDGVKIPQEYEESARIVLAVGGNPLRTFADSFRIENRTVFWDEVILEEDKNLMLTPNGVPAVNSKSAPLPENY